MVFRFVFLFLFFIFLNFVFTGGRAFFFNDYSGGGGFFFFFHLSVYLSIIPFSSHLHLSFFIVEFAFAFSSAFQPSF